MYQYPSPGAAGPVSGGLGGRQGRVQNPCPLGGDMRGKGINKVLRQLRALMVECGFTEAQAPDLSYPNRG